MEIKIDGKKINYETYGEGNPVIILHGWLTDLTTMEILTKYLSKNFKVYAVDIIGFGKSELPDKPYHTDDFGNFLEQFVKQLKIEKPILIGHSNGGKTIINAVGRGLVQPNKIILIDSTGIKPKRNIKYYIKIYTYKIAKKIIKILPNGEQKREKLLGKFGSADYKNSPEVLRKTMSNILNEDQKEKMKNIKVPTLLIWGTNDTATPLSDAKIMEKIIPDAGIVEIKGAGHYSYLENPAQVFSVLDVFLKNDK